ncbi:hypothetical protein [Novosphingobium sp. TCA1]|nr:hypothetical protein [Novosphingobium sp. TCA1]
MAATQLKSKKLNVILNLVQDPVLAINGGSIGKMDPETSSG